MRRRLTVLAAALLVALVAPSAGAADTTPAVPAGFTIETIAHIPAARELTVAPNGDLIVGTNRNNVWIVPDAEGKPAEPKVFATLPDRPVAGVALGGETLYVGGQFGVYTLPYAKGDRTARAEAKKIAAVRTSGQSRDHITTTVALTKGTLYASVGSSCNTCDPELDATRATIQEMKPDGSGIRAKAVRIRNAIALAVNPQSGALWAGVAGQDELADGHPYEIFDDVTAHAGIADYGWPVCYENRRAVGNADCNKVEVPRVVFPAYLTPIGATFYPAAARGAHAFPAAYHGGAFVTLHGSWHTPLRAPRVVFVPMNGDEPKTAVDWSDPSKQWHEFLGGCQNPDGTRNCRPTGVAVGTDGSLFVSEDFGGAIYRIRPR